LILLIAVLWGALIYPKTNDEFESHLLATSHVIHQELMGDTVDCSATAVGPHALVTATHCELASDDIDIDGTQNNQIVKTIRDRHDHTIYLLKGIEFKTFARFSKDPTPPRLTVFAWCNPSMYMHQLRTGSYTGSKSYGGRVIQLYDLKVERGDSGSAIFNYSGEIVGVVSLRADILALSGDPKLKGCGSITLNFSAAELEKARTF